MANNKIYIKRTSTSGRTPNTTNSGNSQYIAAGELALNMADGILYSSNGSVAFEIGANNTVAQVTGNLTVNAIIANGSIGTATQVLTSNGSGVYWAAPGSSSTNTSILATKVYQAFTATDGQTVFTLSSSYTAGAVDVFYNGVHLSNTEYTDNGTSITLTAGANGGAIVEVSGFKTGIASGGNTNIFYNDSGAVGSNAHFTFDSTTKKVTVGNSSVNTQITPDTFILSNTSTNWFIANSSGAYTPTFVANDITANSKISVGTTPAYNFGPLTLIEGDGSANTYLEFNIQNANTGNSASSDLVATADTGNDSVNFIDLGINGSAYNQAGFNIIGALDGYLYTSNGALSIGTASNKELIFHAGGTTSADRKLTVNSTTITITNTVGIFANGSDGNSGDVLSSNGSAVYWSNPMGRMITTALGYNLP